MRAMLGNIETEDLSLVGEQLLPRRPEPYNSDKVKLLIAEEQEILREAYQSFFSQHPNIEPISCSGETDGELLVGQARALKPDVILLGIGALQPTSVETLGMLRENCPEVATVLLAASYDVTGFNTLRRLSRGASVGCAYLLKHTLNSVRELTHVILAVADGRMIIDPLVVDGMVTVPDPSTTLLKNLSPRELELLGLMAKGYRNSTIGDLLSVELKTVERHINSIFNKLGDCPDSKDTRVHAITLYLTATGRLPPEDINFLDN